MKVATGEVSMTVVTLVAIAVIGGILAFLWPQIKNRINTLWDKGCPNGYTEVNGVCEDTSMSGNGSGGGGGGGGAGRINQQYH